MPYQLSTGLATHLAGTGSMLGAMDGGFIKIYAGSVPADADAAIGSATLLCTLTLDGDGTTALALEASGRLVRKPAAASWSGTNVASGTATFYRHVTASDTGAASTTEKRTQGTVGLTNAADMTLVDVGFTSAATFPLNSYVMEQPLHG